MIRIFVRCYKYFRRLLFCDIFRYISLFYPTLTRKCKVTWMRTSRSFELSRYDTPPPSLGGVGDTYKKRFTWNVCVLARTRTSTFIAVQCFPPQLGLNFNFSLYPTTTLPPTFNYKDSNPTKIECFIEGSNLWQTFITVILKWQFLWYISLHIFPPTQI